MKIRAISFFLILIWPLALAARLDDAALKPQWQTASQTAQLAQGNFELFSNVSDSLGIDLTRQTATSFVMAGQAWGDFNNDGRADLYLTNTLEGSNLYYNAGDGKFITPRAGPSANIPRTVSRGAAWGDFDEDGWRDLLVLTDHGNILLRNHEGAEFEDVTEASGLTESAQSTAAAWNDYDQDGDLDLYVVNWLTADHFYRNNGDGTFTDISNLPGLNLQNRQDAGVGVSFADIDNDGDADLYLLNDAQQGPSGHILWLNQGRGCGLWCWENVSASAGLNVNTSNPGLAVGDYDNDLDLDFFLADSLLQNQGNGTFTDIADTVGIASNGSRGSAFLDYDNDGWLDLVVGRTGVDSLFHNNGDGTFGNETPPSWGETRQSTLAITPVDYNEDGLTEFMVSQGNDGYALYHNDGIVGNDNHWLTVRLTGGGAVNTDAIGGRVYITTSDNQVLMREVTSSSILGSGGDTELRFGLGSATVQELKIVWPNGTTNTFANVPVDQIFSAGFATGGALNTEGNSLLMIGLALIMLVVLGVPVWRASVTQSSRNKAAPQA